MTWFNEPDQWTVEGNCLAMFVTPKTDFWRKSHCGFTVDDGPFLYTELGGEFEVTLRGRANYATRFDQAGMMLRVDKENYVKFGIAFVDDRMNVSAVVTHETSDWSIVPLETDTGSLWIKALHRLDAIELFIPWMVFRTG